METVIALRHLRVSYGPQPALRLDEFDVRRGERVALVGPSGAGKTTLLRVCNGSVVPTQGSVHVLGTDITGASASALRALRRRVGTVHQQLHLVGPLRVVHNVNAGHLGEWSTTRALRSLVRPHELDGARAALARMGIADKLLERTDRLSGGEQQRVALARIVVQQPDLVLADEPVSSLDRAHSEEVMDLLCHQVAADGQALVVSLHDFDLARRRCDRLVGIRGGELRFDLPSADVTDAMADDLYRLVR